MALISDGSTDVIDRLGIRLSSKLHEYTHPMYGGIVKYIAYVCSNYLSKLIELAAIKYAMVGAVQMKLGRDRIRDDKIKVDIKSLRDLIEDKLNYIENGDCHKMIDHYQSNFNPETYGTVIGMPKREIILDIDNDDDLVHRGFPQPHNSLDQWIYQWVTFKMNNNHPWSY